MALVEGWEGEAGGQLFCGGGRGVEVHCCGHGFRHAWWGMYITLCTVGHLAERDDKGVVRLRLRLRVYLVVSQFF